jgi:hypothetical protein
MPCRVPIDPSRSRRRLSRVLSHGLLLACLLATTAVTADTPEPGEQRLTVRAKLDPRAAAIADQRFVVRAVLLPQRTAPLVHLGGGLEPKSTQAWCYGPGSIFHDSFEGSLP